MVNVFDFLKYSVIKRLYFQKKKQFTMKLLNTYGTEQKRTFDSEIYYISGFKRRS